MLTAKADHKVGTPSFHLEEEPPCTQTRPSWPWLPSCCWDMRCSECRLSLSSCFFMDSQFGFSCSQTSRFVSSPRASGKRIDSNCAAACPRPPGPPPSLQAASGASRAGWGAGPSRWAEPGAGLNSWEHTENCGQFSQASWRESSLHGPDCGLRPGDYRAPWCSSCSSAAPPRCSRRYRLYGFRPCRAFRRVQQRLAV